MQNVSTAKRSEAGSCIC